MHTFWFCSCRRALQAGWTAGTLGVGAPVVADPPQLPDDCELRPPMPPTVPVAG